MSDRSKILKADTRLIAIAAYELAGKGTHSWDGLTSEVASRVDLGHLRNVNISGLSIDQGLKWDGTNWVNSGDMGGIVTEEDPVFTAWRDDWAQDRIAGRIATGTGTIEQLTGVNVRSITGTLEYGTGGTQIRNNTGLDGRYGQLAVANTWTEAQSIRKTVDGLFNGLNIHNTKADSTTTNPETSISFLTTRGNDGVSTMARITVGRSDIFDGTATRSGHLAFSTVHEGMFDERMRLHSGGGLSINKTTLTSGYKLDVNGKGIFQDDLALMSDLINPAFTSGWQGTNYKVWEIGDAEFRNVKIRGGLEVWELILNQIRYQDGGLIIGSGGGKVASVFSATVGSEQVYFEDPEGNGFVPFTVGHIVMMQVFDINSTTVISRIVRQVSAVQGDGRIDFTTTTGWATTDDVGTIGKSDVIVGIGHVSNTAYQNLIYMSAVDSGAPFTRYFSGIDSYAKFNLGNQEAIKVAVGNLESITNATGFGFYGKRSYLTEYLLAGDLTKAGNYMEYTEGILTLEGRIIATSGLIANWDIGEEEIHKTSGLYKVELSSAQQRLAFIYDSKDRAVFRSGAIESLVSLKNSAAPSTTNANYNVTFTSPQSFNVLGSTFTIGEGLTDINIRFMYESDGAAFDIDAAFVGVDIILCDSEGVAIETAISGYAQSFDSVGIHSEIIRGRAGFMSAGTYRLRATGTVTDVSEGGMGDPALGTFTIGGASSDHANAIVYPDAAMRTEVGNNGLLSFWGGDSYFHLSPSGFATHNMGVSIWNLAMKGNIKLTASGSADADFNYNGIELQGKRVILRGNSIESPNLPTSTAGLQSGRWYRDGNYIKIV